MILVLWTMKFFITQAAIHGRLCAVGIGAAPGWIFFHGHTTALAAFIGFHWSLLLVINVAEYVGLETRSMHETLVIPS